MNSVDPKPRGGQVGGFRPECPKCGYDLDSFVPLPPQCPECGNRIDPKTLRKELTHRRHFVVFRRALWSYIVLMSIIPVIDGRDYGFPASRSLAIALAVLVFSSPLVAVLSVIVVFWRRSLMDKILFGLVAAVAAVPVSGLLVFFIGCICGSMWRVIRHGG